MDPKIKSEYTKALLSGKYHQTQGALCRFDPKVTVSAYSYCVFGVLCDLYSKSHNVSWDVLKGQFFSDGSTRAFLGQTIMLPTVVRDWAGVAPGAPPLFLEGAVIVRGHTHSVMGLNDAGWTFKQLAKLINDQW